MQGRFFSLTVESRTLPGQLFLAVIQLIVVPLVIGFVIRGLAASENVDQLRKLGLRACGYLVATTPNAETGVQTMAIPNASELPTALIGLLPGNPLNAMAQGEMLQVVIFGVIVLLGLLGVGIVILATVLSAVGIPPEGVALIMGVDRILDMCRTSVNVAGDVVAAKLMDKWLGDEGERSLPDEAPMAES